MQQLEVRKDRFLNDSKSRGHCIHCVLCKNRPPQQVPLLRFKLQQSESTEQVIGQAGIGAAMGVAIGAGVMEMTGAGIRGRRWTWSRGTR
jgi:hypothetical protein